MRLLNCVAGGVAVGMGIQYALSRVFARKRQKSSDSGVWFEPGSFTHPEGTPEGFTLRKTVDAGDLKLGVDVMMEKWEAGSEEPIHSHPGDDMTLVVEGEMNLQFFKRGPGGELVEDGPRVYLKAGDVGYVAAGRIHDAKYTKDCKLVYVHNKTFGFTAEK